MAGKKTTKTYSFSIEITKGKFWIGFSGVVVILLALLWILRGFFIVEIVNGTPITRWQIDADLEDRYGSLSLDSAVNNTLLLQEAARRGIIATPNEINKRIKQLKAQVAQNHEPFDLYLQTQAETERNLPGIIKLEIIAEKMFGKSIHITQGDVLKFIQQNSGAYPPFLPEAQREQEAYNDDFQFQLQDRAQALTTQLKKRANIINYMTFAIH